MEDEANNTVDRALATTMHVLQLSVSRMLNQHSPSALAFHPDMFLNLPLQADLQAIQQQQQIYINENLRRQNEKQRSMDYQVGQQILVKDKDGRKLDSKTTGAYPIVKVHVNGSLTIRCREHVLEGINIRRALPYH